MQKRAVFIGLVALGMLGALTVAGQAKGATSWIEGKHYFRIQPAQRTHVPAGKVEVAEAFSYGCPACDHFLPVMGRLEASLPPDAQIVYVPASFNQAEQWPMFQRAFVAAQVLGIVEKTHVAMFNAVWKTGELAVIDPRTGKLKQPPPTIEDAARFYARTAGVPAEQFLATARSFSVELGMKRADEWFKACQIDQTPTMVVNGKYRLHVASAGGVDQMIELINWLVAKESAATQSAAHHP
jgi:protein dithiol oxidoreductase (disulfide-forming)